MERSAVTRDTSFVFDSELQGREKLLWSGQPVPQWFGPEDIFMIPFSLMWGGFAYFWEYMVVSTTLKGHGGPGWFMAIWGIPFCVIGTWMIFGRFFTRMSTLKNTYYAITTDRVLTLTKGRQKSVQSTFLKDIASFDKIVGANGVGTISFTSSAMAAALPIQSPIGKRALMQVKVVHGGIASSNRIPTSALSVFYNVPNCDYVCSILSSQLKKDDAL